MNNIMLNQIRKTVFISIFISLFANAETSIVVSDCTLESSTEFGHTGDTSGKRVNTKEEFTYKCIETRTTKGTCARWEETVENLDLSFLNPGKVHFETEDYSGSLGETMAVIQGYDKINGLWSGWKGLCQKGKDDGNFDWMSDPYVIGSYVLAAYSGGATDSATSTAAESAATEQAATSAAEEAATQAATAELVQMSVCAARAGIDVAQMVEEYEDDGIGCDPVDEICGGEESAQNNDSEVFTLPENKFNDLMAKNPEMEGYYEIVRGEGTGVITVKVVNPETEEDDATAKEAEEAAKELKEKVLKFKAALTTIQLAGCVTGSGATSANTNDSDPTSAKNLAMMAITQINPVVGILLDMAMRTFESMKDINTCDDEGAAKEKGSRHIATLKAKELKQCTFLKETANGGTFTLQRRYYYCCYDDRTTRTIVEQAKAQLAKDWQHCADISLKELQYIKFKACDPVALDAAIDGTKLDYYATQAERFTSYQYQNKCIDTREFTKTLMDMFSGDNMLIDTEEIKKILEDLI